MRAISTGELNRLKDHADDVLSSLATIKRVTQASDSMGGFTETESIVETVACLVHKPGADLIRAITQSIGDRIDNREISMIVLPSAATVELGNRLYIGSDTFEVVAMPQNSYAINITVIGAKL